MIEQLVAPHGALTAARALARDVCRCAPTATALALRQVRAAADGSLDAALEAETVAGARALASGEVAEGVRAFASHEAPQWSNIGPVLDSDSSSAR